MTRYQHIFFDLDHTLWDFHSNSVETLSELFLAFELDQLSQAPSDQYFIDRYVFHNERMWDLYRQNRMSKSRLRKARFEAALMDVGINDKKLAKRLGEAYLEACPKKTKLNEGAIEVVKELSAISTLHILSNGFHETQLTKLDHSGLAPYFKEVITSERAQAKKPDPRIYQFAQKVTKALPHESIMIGDNVAIDIVGAANAGWDVVHYNEFGEEHSYPSVTKLGDLLPILLSEGRQ